MTSKRKKKYKAVYSYDGHKAVLQKSAPDGYKVKKHEHIWKYKGSGWIRICEAPIPTIESCGRVETKDGEGKWIHA